MFDWLLNLFRTAPKEVSVNMTLPSGYTNLVVPDRRISPNFTLYELTKTSVQVYQNLNRTITVDQINKLRNVALLLENVRLLMGGQSRVNVHSGYRCKKVNDLIGSNDRSQHLLCEAADFDIEGYTLPVIFQRLQDYATQGKIYFGQLIYERANRPYGVSEWLHVSLGKPYRDLVKCGQVLTMKTGADGKPAYELVKIIAAPKTEATV